MSFFAPGTHQNRNLLIADNTERNAIDGPPIGSI